MNDALDALPFHAPALLANPHLQTILGAIHGRGVRVNFARERLELPDGDFLDLDFARTTGPAVRDELVVVVHGLGGSSRSTYVQRLVTGLGHAGFDACAVNLRGCSGEPNRLLRSYHSGVSEDLDAVVEYLVATRQRPYAVVGYSLGGNLSLKWLGEQGDDAAVACAAAISVPMQLTEAVRRLDNGVSRIYQWWMLKSLREALREKLEVLSWPEAPELDRLNTFEAFDEHVTAPLHGFESAADYYARASSMRYLAGIRKPTLIVQALDDPFMTEAVIPVPERLSSSVHLELCRRGGHVGFLTLGPTGLECWLESRIIAWLESVCEDRNPRKRDRSQDIRD